MGSPRPAPTDGGPALTDRPPNGAIMSIVQPQRQPATTEAAGGHSAHVWTVRLLSYLTNRIVAYIPSHSLRRWWYRRMVGVRIGPGSSLHLGCYLWFFGPGQVRRTGLIIGRNSIINRDCCLDGRAPLHIGSNVSISPYVTILTTQHGPNDPDFRLTSAPVVLEDHVWVGTRAMILPGVTIGRGAVVGAGSVVTKDVEPLSIIGGVPAQVIGRRSLDPRYELRDLSPLFE